MEQQEPRPYESQIPVGRESKGSSAPNPWTATAEWLGKTGVAAITAAGLLLYVFLRLPYSLFYGRLGTSPEELGLGYAEILAQSTVGVFAISIVVLMIVLAAAYVITYASLAKRAIRASGAEVRWFPPQLLTTPFWELEQTVFNERLDATLQFWREFGLRDELLQEWVHASRELYDLRNRLSTSPRNDAQEQQLERSLKGFQVSLPTILRNIGRISLVWLRRRGLILYGVVLLLVLTVLVPFASIAEASSVKGGHGSRFPWLGLFGLRGDPASVVWVETPSDDDARAISSNPNLVLLGKSAESVVLFDHRTDRVIRLPPGGIVVATREP